VITGHQPDDSAAEGTWGLFPSISLLITDLEGGPAGEAPSVPLGFDGC